VPIVLKPGSLILLEPYRPVHACNGIALPLMMMMMMIVVVVVVVHYVSVSVGYIKFNRL
jgi:hypothetical protein